MLPDLKTLPAYRVKFAADPAKAGVISGYGSIAGNIDSYGEIVERGAFTKSIANYKRDKSAPRMLWQHNPDMPIGSWTDFGEDANGLFMSGKINLETSWGKDAWAATQAGDVDGLSIGYREVKATPDGIYRRLEELALLEVSVVTFPANPKTRVRLDSKRDLESVLVKSGLSQAAAVKIAAGGWNALAKTPDAQLAEAIAKALNTSLLKLKEL